MIPITSFAVIMYGAMLHAIEALIMALTNQADGSIGMAALLRATGNRYAAAAVMALSVITAGIVLTQRRIGGAMTVALLVPQQVLLMTTGIAAWLAAWDGMYADGVVRSTLFITADQLPRGMFPLIHMTAVYALATYNGLVRK